MTHIQNTLLMQSLLDKRLAELRTLPHNSDLWLYYNNLRDMLTEASRLEVYARRTPPRSRYNVEYKKKLKELETGINYLDQLILIQRLMG